MDGRCNSAYHKGNTKHIKQESDKLDKINLTINTLFAGVGMQEKGIENTILFNPEVVSVSEIDKEAIVSYAAIHCGLTPELISNSPDYPSNDEMAEHLTKINLGYNPEKNKCYDWYKLSRKKSGEIRKYWLACKLANNIGDINKVKSLSYADLWTCSFPCTDISVAGQMKGLSPDSGTRSSLLWENIRLLKLAKENNNLPKYILIENVKNLVSKKYIKDFNNLLEVLDELGFNSYWKVLNAKDCGVPQNRERVFVISIRKDVDKGKFEFPKPFDSGIRLKDVLDKDVDEKYYLSDDIQKRFKVTDDIYNANTAQIPMDKSINETNFNLECSNCITAREDRGVSNRKSEGTAVLELTNNCIQAGNLTSGKWDKIYESARRYYSPDGISPTLHTCGGGNTETKIIEPTDNLSHAEWKQQMFERFVEDCDGEVSGVITNQSQTFGYRPPMKGYSKCIRAEANDTGIVEPINTKPDGTCRTIKAQYAKTSKANFKYSGTYGATGVSCSDRIRKLTPNECWKLMGLTTEDFRKAKTIGTSDSQLYKQAGNGLVTNCVQLIFEHLYKAQYDNTYICTDENFQIPPTK